jgi:hypothetical protein
MRRSIIEDHYDPASSLLQVANGYHHDNMPIKVIYNCPPALPFLFAGIGSLSELKSAYSLADSDGAWIVDAWTVWSFLNTKIVRAAICRCAGTSPLPFRHASNDKDGTNGDLVARWICMWRRDNCGTDNNLLAAAWWLGSSIATCCDQSTT